MARRVRRLVPTYGIVADELEGEALVLLVVAVDHFNPERGVPVEQWAAWFISRRLRDLMRRKNLHDATHAQIEDDFDAVSAAEGPEEIEHRRSLQRQVQRALTYLPSRTRKVVTLRYSRDLSHREVGPHVGLKASRVGDLHAEGLRELRRLLPGLEHAA